MRNINFVTSKNSKKAAEVQQQDIEERRGNLSRHFHCNSGFASKSEINFKQYIPKENYSSSFICPEYQSIFSLFKCLFDYLFTEISKECKGPVRLFYGSHTPYL